MKLQNLLGRAAQAQAAVASYNSDGTVRHVHPQAPAAVDHVAMRSFEIPKLVNTDSRSTVTPTGTEAGQVHQFADVVLAASRVAQAGSRIVMLADAAEAVPMPNGELGWKRETTQFEIISPSQFTLLPDGDDATETAIPIARALAERETLPTYAARHVLTRAERRAFEDGHVAATVSLGLAMGVARILDSILLEAILATTPASFSLGAAAAQGLTLAELRALAGQDGDGALIDPAGALRVNGIEAEFTNTISPSVIGAFGRSALACSERLTLVVERVNLQSDLTLTAFVNASALLPAPDCFWVGA